MIGTVPNWRVAIVCVIAHVEEFWSQPKSPHVTNHKYTPHLASRVNPQNNPSGMPLWYAWIMAISPKCDICRKELQEFGAILLSPPNDQSQVIKHHLCVICYEALQLPPPNES